MNNLPKKPLIVSDYVHSQSWMWESIWLVSDRVLRVTICCNSSESRAYQTVELFDGDQWNRLVWRPNKEFAKDVSYSQKALTAKQTAALKVAEMTLLNEASLILAAHKAFTTSPPKEIR